MILRKNTVLELFNFVQDEVLGCDRRFAWEDLTVLFLRLVT